MLLPALAFLLIARGWSLTTKVSLVVVAVLLPAGLLWSRWYMRHGRIELSGDTLTVVALYGTRRYSRASIRSVVEAHVRFRFNQARLLLPPMPYLIFLGEDGTALGGAMVRQYSDESLAHLKQALGKPWTDVGELSQFEVGKRYRHSFRWFVLHPHLVALGLLPLAFIAYAIVVAIR